MSVGPAYAGSCPRREHSSHLSLCRRRFGSSPCPQLGSSPWDSHRDYGRTGGPGGFCYSSREAPRGNCAVSSRRSRLETQNFSPPAPPVLPSSCEKISSRAAWPPRCHVSFCDSGRSLAAPRCDERSARARNPGLPNLLGSSKTRGTSFHAHYLILANTRAGTPRGAHYLILGNTRTSPPSDPH
jgi:hypothetical protein